MGANLTQEHIRFQLQKSFSINQVPPSYTEIKDKIQGFFKERIQRT